MFFVRQNLLISSEQSTIILKSLTKLPNEFDMVIYPTLVVIVHENPAAKEVLSKDFDVQVSKCTLIASKFGESYIFR